MKSNYLLKALSLLFISVLLILNSCTSSGTLADADLNSLNIDIIHYGENQPYYIFTVSDFDSQNQNYDAALNRLKQYYPDDVIEISENSDTYPPTLSAKIKAHPLSLNRVIWLFGKEQYKKHSVEYKPDLADGEYVIISQMPELIDDINDIQKQVRYPSELKDSGIEGRVMVNFIVNQFGEVENPEIVSGLHESADREAIRVVQQLQFNPGLMNGVPIRVRYSMPVFFRDR